MCPRAGRCECGPGRVRDRAGRPPRERGFAISLGVANSAIPEKSSTGLQPNVAAALSYAAWWISGLFFFLVERESGFVKFHAAQAMAGLGAVWALGFVVWGLAFAALFVSAILLTVLLYVAYAVWALGIVLWAICIVRAWKGETFELPFAGAFARRLTN